MDQVFSKEDIMAEAECLRFYNRKLHIDMWRREKMEQQINETVEYVEAQRRVAKAAENRASYMKDVLCSSNLS